MLNFCKFTERIFGSYDSKEDQENLRTRLQDAFMSGALVCLICIDNVKRNNQVNDVLCYYCYNIINIVLQDVQ